MKRFSISLLMTCLFSLSVSAQEGEAIIGNLHSRTASLSVRSLVQQDNGMIWFGTDRNLYSYDGYDLRPHACPDGHIQVNALLCMSDKLLLGTNDGMYSFCLENYVYHRAAPLDKQMIRTLRVCQGNVFVGSDEGLYRYDPEVDTATRLLEGDIFSLVAHGDSLFVGTQEGVSLYRPDTGTITAFFRPHNLGARTMAISILPDGDRIWIGTARVLYCLDIHSGEVLDEAPFMIPKMLCKDWEGRLLVGTDNGLYSYDSSGKQEKLLSSVTWVCTEDADDNLWFGTDDGLRPMWQHPTVRPVRGLPDEDNAHYTDLYRDSKGRLWLAGSDGIVLMEGQGVLRHYTMTDPTHRIRHNRIWRIVEDRENGSMYFASDGGIQHYDGQSGQMEQVPIAGSHNWVYDLIPFRGELWAASFDGLYRLKRDGTVIGHYGQSEGLSSNDIARIVIGRQGMIWALTRDQHLFRIDPDTQHVIPSDTGVGRPDDICGDREGRIWVVAGNKVHRITPGGKDDGDLRTMTFHPDDEMESFCLTDSDERIWICTSEGLFSVGKEEMNVSSLGTYRHYFGLEFDASTNSLLLGSVGSVDILRLDELDLAEQSREPVIHLTGILVNGSRKIEPGKLGKERLVLPARQNHLDISFSDFDFNDEFPHRFEYRLEGHSSLMRSPVVGNKFTLSALQPGRYRLSVARAGNLSNATELLSFRIRPFWIYSWWMILVYLLVIAATAFAFIRQAVMRRNLLLERRQRDELLAQSRQKEAFFQEVAHEFKTPLSLVIGPLGKMIREAGPDTDLHSLKLAQENATKLSSLIHHTIDYYKDTDGVADSLISTDVEMVDFARSIFDSYRENYPKHEFIFNSSHPVIPVEVDIVKVETILNNLLSNACKYTPEGGSVLLTLERDDEGHQLIVKVSDTGVGIPEDELQFAFQRYFQSSRTKNNGYDSTGIGLSVIKSYVEVHGGRVSISSDENGTTFTVLLPCLSDHTSFPSTAPDAPEDPDKPLIAIVDDNAQICTFLESILKEKYRCISSHNGKSGLKLCKDVLPDLIVSDVLMPVMDGLEMCRQIRQYGPLSTVPIILLTAKDDKQTEQQSIGLDIDVFLPKPFEVPTLTARVDQLLGNKKRMEQRLRMELLATPEPSRELSQDERFLRKVTRLVEEHLDDADLSVSRLCELGEFSEKQLYRKLKQFTGMSAVEYIRYIRLKKAALLLQNGNYTVSEVMYSVGFSNASYFTRTFSAAYNMTPSDYMKSFKNK